MPISTTSLIPYAQQKHISYGNVPNSDPGTIFWGLHWRYKKEK